MPEIDQFPPGLPSWADLATPDDDESASFYEELLGLEAGEGSEEHGGYRIFFKDGKQIAGLMKIQNEGQPPSWTTYINVEDADDVTEKVKDADGEVHVEPMDVGDLGRMAVYGDNSGAVFGVWQPGEHKGSEVVSEPGSIAWHQVNTRDPEDALEFYSQVFGWESEQVDTGGADYWQLTKDGANVGGVFRMGDDFPDEVPAHWIVYFAVEDCDAATEKAKENGATVNAEPFDNEAGRFSVLQDPHGAAFALINQGGGSVVNQESEEDSGDEDSGEEDSGDDSSGESAAGDDSSDEKDEEDETKKDDD
jgi:predicted enzyme related to lactoylglutathione lyase